jgi:hypothetical protein
LRAEVIRNFVTNFRPPQYRNLEVPLLSGIPILIRGSVRVLGWMLPGFGEKFRTLLQKTMKN